MAGSIPKRVFAVIAVAVFVAFFLGGYVSTTLTHWLAPYAFFGVTATNAQHISIIEDHRGSILFSNGVAVSGMKLLRVVLLWVVLCVVFMQGLFWSFVHLAAMIIRRRDADWADDVLHFMKFAPEDGH